MPSTRSAPSMSSSRRTGSAVDRDPEQRLVVGRGHRAAARPSPARQASQRLPPERSGTTVRPPAGAGRIDQRNHVERSVRKVVRPPERRGNIVGRRRRTGLSHADGPTPRLVCAVTGSLTTPRAAFRGSTRLLAEPARQVPEIPTPLLDVVDPARDLVVVEGGELDQILLDRAVLRVVGDNRDDPIRAVTDRLAYRSAAARLGRWRGAGRRRFVLRW